MKPQSVLSALVLVVVVSTSAHHQTFAQTASAQPQTPLAASAPTAVPSLVPYSGAAIASDGKPLTGETGINFQIYKDEHGGEALWTESQTVAIDSTGHYKVQLGATSPNGLPAGLFSTGEARWLDVQIAGEAAQPRVLLASVPYALKAGDATTLGGLPASAFALAGAKVASDVNAQGGTPDLVSDVTTTGGTTGYLPEFSGASTIVDSPVFVNGSNVGIGTATPAQTLDVNGTTVFRSNIYVYHNGVATPSGGVNSVPMVFLTEGYNSSTKAVVAPSFQWKAEVVGNNTASPSATQNLIYSNGTTAAETGFHFNPNGTINFAPGQTFSGGALTGQVNATGYDLGGSSFATGSTSGGTAYLGFAGNAGSSGTGDTGVGYQALSSNATGSGNTAIGFDSLVYNATGGSNTGLGYFAGPDSGSSALTNSTALGANATVSQSNSLVLGATTVGSPGATYVNVGIGTATPRSILEASVNASGALGPALTLTNTAGGLNAAASIDFNTYYHPAIPYNNPTARIEAVDDNHYGNGLYFQSKTPGSDSNGLQTNMVIFSDGKVGIGAAGPVAQLNVVGPSESGTTAISGTGASLVASGPTAIAGDGGDFVGGDIVGESDEGFGGYGIRATGGTGPGSPGVAGFFSGGVFVDGEVSVAGTLFASVKDFKIDHPLDPANKYLVHSSVESSEMMNIYSGNVVTDELGLGTIKLPGWFEAENTDFRYQLTVIGQFAQAIIKDKIANGQFRIMTNASHVEVSWQITAVRQDAYAKAHPLVIEQEKPERERGFYQNPELYGQPAEKQTEWGRRPQQMQRMKQMQEQLRLREKQPGAPR
jgi:hypothetical protein